MKVPNFFIIGAPKCGTTALAEYLRAHPNILLSDPKEPHFFASDFDGHRPVRTFDAYLSLFEGAKSGDVAVGEASVWYLYSQSAVQNIRAFNPDARLIVMVRNPIEFLCSLHGQFLYSQYEDEENFEKAWSLQDARRAGRRIPKTCRQAEFLQYQRVARFGEQLDRTLRIFPSSLVKVIVFDDFVSDTRQEYERVLAFLGVPSDERCDFPRINAYKKHRFQALGRLSEAPPSGLVSAALRAKRLVGIERWGILDRIRTWNAVEGSRKPISASFQRELSEVYRADVERLSRLLDRDLGHWLQGPRSVSSAGDHKNTL